MQNALAETIGWDEQVENLVTEDDEPVDNLISAKQMRLLVEALYSSWKPLTEEELPQPRKFLADCDIGIFTSPYQSPIVPDMFLSLDVEANENFYEKKNRSYFFWEFDKMPEVAVEIVSNKKGDEMTTKMTRYAKMGFGYYVVFDPLRELNDDVLRVYELGFGGRRYHLRRDFALPDVGLSLTLWQGEFEKANFEWLRWCDLDGNLILTGKERAEVERKNVEVERNRAENAESKLAELLAKLREAGIDESKL